MLDPKYVKRAMIISPSVATQKYLSRVTLNNFGADFDSCSRSVEIQPFESIGDTYSEDFHPASQIGKGGEILVFFDELLSREKSLKTLLYAAEKNCDDLKVPFLVYKANSINLRDLTWFVKREGGQNHEYTGIYESSRGPLSSTFRERVLACLKDERVFEKQIPRMR